MRELESDFDRMLKEIEKVRKSEEGIKHRNGKQK